MGSTHPHCQDFFSNYFGPSAHLGQQRLNVLGVVAVELQLQDSQRLVDAALVRGDVLLDLLRVPAATRDGLKVGIRTTLPTTERLLWHCGAHTAKPESAL